MKSRRAGCGALLLVAALAAAWLLLVPEPAPGPVGGWMAAARVATAFVDTGGVRVRYVRAGSGPSVVLLHGFASSLYTWKDVLPALAADHDVIALDFPGFGGSQVPRPLDAATFPGVVLAVMDQLGVRRASLVGNSLGGAVAVGIAADHPERVDRLVLVDSAGFNFAPRDRPLLLRLVGAPGMASLLERLPIRRRMVEAGLRQVFANDALVTRERVDEYTVPMLRPGAVRAASEVLGRLAPSEFPVARVRVPTLVIWGREDRWIPLAHAGRFVAAIPGSRLEVIDACGHVPQEEQPAAVAALLARFLAAPARVY